MAIIGNIPYFQTNPSVKHVFLIFFGLSADMMCPMCPMCPDFCSEHRTSDTTGRPNSFLQRNWSCGPWPVTGRQLNAMPGRVSESCNGSNPQRLRLRCARTSMTRGSATTFGGRTNIPSSTWKRWTRRWHGEVVPLPKSGGCSKKDMVRKNRGTFWTFWKEQEVHPYYLKGAVPSSIWEGPGVLQNCIPADVGGPVPIREVDGQPLWVHDLFEKHKGWVHAGFLDARPGCEWT